MTEAVKKEIVKPYRVRWRDELSFTLGVANMCLTTHLLSFAPQHFYMWYTMWAIPLLLWRWWTYRMKKWQYFLIDYCYSVNLLCGLHLFVFPTSSWMFTLMFMSANGPLGSAIIAWRCSLVFHDLEKVSSVFIHIMPPLLSFCQRWYPHLTGAPPPPYLDTGITFAHFMALPLGFYLLWQLLYYYKTEVMDAPKLEADPEIETSLRYMTRRPEGPLYDLVLSIARMVGYMGPHEKLTDNGAKTKMLFMSAQLVYTIVTLLPTPLMYTNMYVHIAFLALYSLAATHNGARFYFEVFAKRYMKEVGAAVSAATQAEATRMATAAYAAVEATATQMAHERSGTHASPEGGAMAMPTAAVPAQPLADAHAVGAHRDQDGDMRHRKREPSSGADA